ncbi:ribosomal RNA processing protein 1 homolog A-like isoform X2 [Pecten maximus]|uniref:ribosomal RNA processing protein 1 homolog A-like isoform X2 n=1 Tax=Pecten maximus TaxID=6579 RepID=UPI0014588529|nr:ribosomal RNA processing protein 1 homolog A-like isoform X2 [Pecten maximus]
MGEMATTVEINDSAEIHFAQRLASNRKPIRDRALKKLRKWLEAKSNTHKDAFSESDFVKIWKGLHYCLWMQDKPLLQEELTERITQMVHVFGTAESSLLFVKVFFQTEAREWDVLDKWRVDKFMTLVRKMLHQTLLFLKNKKWRRNILTEFTSILSSHVMSPDNEKIPQGLRIHLADVYLAELENVGAEQLSPELVLVFLEPIFQYVSSAVNTDVMKRVVASVFEVILKQTLDDAMEAAKVLIQKEEEGCEVDPEDLDMPIRLQYEFSAIADRLFQLGSNTTCRTKNRTIIYEWVKKFRDLDEGAITREEDIAPGISKRLKKTKKKRKTKKRKGSSPADLSDDSEEDISPNKKLKSEEETEEGTINKDEIAEGKKVKKDKKKSADVTKTNKSEKNKKKKKNRENASEKLSTDNCDEGDLNETEFDSSSVNVTRIKRKKKVPSSKISGRETEALAPSANLFDVPPGLDMDVSSQILPKRKTSKSKKGVESEGQSKTKKTSDTSEDVLQDEVEIWIPNKKYMKKRNSSMETSEKKSPGAQFAKFDVNLTTPPAFLRKAVAKSTPKSGRKRTDQVMESEALSTPGGRKRVSFNMNKNEAKEFHKKTLIESKEDAFIPSRTPEQGILKTTPSSTRSKIRKNSTPNSSRRATPKSSKRPKATDFF